MTDAQSHNMQEQDYKRLLHNTKQQIGRGLTVQNAAIPPFLIQSWQRSHGYGLSPDDQCLTGKAYFSYPLSESDRYLASIVGQEIDAIWDSFGGANWVVYCTNIKSLIIRTKQGTNPASRTFAMHTGRRIQECDLGTNAPNCAIQEGIPIFLSGSEHYLEEFEDLFCCSVPLWGAWGKIIGALNITGNETFKSKLVEKKLLTAATKITNQLFLETHHTSQIFRFHYDAGFIDTHMAGLIATTESGDIVATNHNGMEMIDPINPFRKRYRMSDLLRGRIVTSNRYCSKVSLPNGIILYLKSHEASENNSFITTPPIAATDALCDIRDLYILEVIKKAGGNISKAAHILGISRTTLYRSLHRSQNKKSP
ncbi:helix-turn-helix domain-containing protein [Acetobacteraceae bacterium ESL0709]|nr:helix-turn-helix domain-containing protein [Acetobacteraceae bacterium ESL0697]MDF7677307.1 helix-turn-helix domain-containing protein [Acetobacteraceae bacterium ESL0709]